MKIECAKSETHMGITLTPETEFEKSYVEAMYLSNCEGLKVIAQADSDELAILVPLRKQAKIS